MGRLSPQSTCRMTRCVLAVGIWAGVSSALGGDSGRLVFANGPEIAYSRTTHFEQPVVGSRPRLAKETLLYAEFLVKYGMFQDYLHYWIDRPLFWNRATRPEKFEYETPASFEVHGAQLVRHGLDGFDIFVNKRQVNTLSKLDDWFVAAGTPQLNVLPIVSYGESVNKSGPDVKAFAAVVREMQQRPRATRINGKVLVPTYNYRMFKAAQHKQFYADLVRELGNGDFVLCGDVDMAVLMRLQEIFHQRGALTVSQQAELEQALRDVLDAVGGIQLSATEKRRNPRGQYCSYYDLSFFDTYTAPMIARLLALPEYRDKVLGFYVHQGYVNHFTGHDHSEEGTFTLRSNLASVMRLNPDYLIFFEWNEVNENTMFQPTVWGGTLAGRIVRWHSRLMKGLPPDPFPGDDTSVPPLALTYRATAKCGELLHFEVLNVPDGVWTKPMSVQLSFADVDGKTVAAFPPETIDPSKLGSVDYRFPSTALPGGTVLVPSLVVDGRVHTGFSPLRIDPTVSFIYKAVRHPLRDLANPRRVTAEVKAKAKGLYDYSLQADFGEPLASVELIENENEQAACGAEGEFDFTSNVVVRLAFTVPRDGAVRGGCLRVAVSGASGCRFAPLWLANVDAGRLTPLKDTEGFSVRTLFWTQETAYIIQVPKSQIGSAKIAVAVENQARFTPAVFAVKDLVDQGVAGAVMNADTSFRVDARRIFDVPSLPPQLGTASVNWRGTTETRTPYPVFHFRAITVSGRLWRSRPFRPDALPAVDTVVPVWDEVLERPSTARTPGALVPVLDYRFDPTAGAALVNGHQPFFNAHLGGGIFYCEAYSGIDRGRIAPGCRAPAWRQEEGRWCLAFDGVNDYINFPREAFPQAAFTLEMEVKPQYDPAKPMTLFRHFSWIRGSLSLFIREGELFATWGDRDLTREPKFTTGLKVNNGEWNEIFVSYDFRELVFRVNGVARRLPWEGRAYAFKPAIFGGHDKVELGTGKVPPGYFRGLLRRFTIHHNAR